MAIAAPESPLTQIKTVLEHLQFPTYLMEASAEIPFEQLLVSLDPESEQQVSLYVMQLMFSEDILHASAHEAVLPLEARTENVTLQFFMDLPMTFAPERLLDTYRLVSAYNKLLPLGGLNLTEHGDKSGLFFHYAHVVERAHLSISVVVDILETVQFFLTLFVPQLQAFQHNQKDLATVLQETEAAREHAIASLSAATSEV
jgi:hypothetical protein